jgi:hypothetical protein
VFTANYVVGRLEAGRAILLSQTARLSSRKRPASFLKMLRRVSSITWWEANAASGLGNEIQNIARLNQFFFAIMSILNFMLISLGFCFTTLLEKRCFYISKLLLEQPEHSKFGNIDSAAADPECFDYFGHRHALDYKQIEKLIIFGSRDGLH